MVAHKAVLVNALTGTVEAECMLVVAKRKRNGFGQGWIAMDQEMLAKIAKEIKSLEEMRVLNFILSRVAFNNIILATQAEVCKELGMLRPNVSKAFRRLQEAGIISEAYKQGSSKFYRLNPAYAWKGKASEHVRAIREF